MSEDKQKYISEKQMDFMESMNFEDSIMMDRDKNELYNQIQGQVFELMWSLKQLRTVCNNDGKLPLYPIKSDYEDLILLSDMIEDEVLKFGQYPVVNREYVKFSNEDIKELMDDPIGQCEYGDWINEGLFKNLLNK